MFRVDFRTGSDGRIRWFVVNKDTGVIQYSGFPLSFGTDQEAWEHAEWAIGASVSMTYVHPEEGFTNFAGSRDWNN